MMCYEELDYKVKCNDTIDINDLKNTVEKLEYLENEKAVQYISNDVGDVSFSEYPRWLERAVRSEIICRQVYLTLPLRAFYEVKTLEGVMKLEKGDWLIRGVKGELYPCKDEIFKMTYEEVKE